MKRRTVAGPAMTAHPCDDEALVRFGSAATGPPRPAASSHHASTPEPVRAVPVDNGWPTEKAVVGGFTPPPTADTLVGRRPTVADVPRQGWRRVLYRTTGLNPGLSAAELELRRDVERVNTPFTGPRHVLFANPKGGAGKTTTCLGLAATFGQHRGRGVIAFDNTPTRGTLALRAHQDTHDRTVKELLADIHTIGRVGDLAPYIRSQPDGHFDVLASDEDPVMAVSRGERDYVAVMQTLDAFYNVICVDTGNDVTAPVFTAAVATAHQLVVVTGGTWDSAHSASWMLDHLEEHGYARLVRRAVTVVTLPRGRASDLRAINEHFTARTRAVHHVRFDPALDTGGEVELHRLRPRTRRAWLDAAAAIADDFPAHRPTPLQEFS